MKKMARSVLCMALIIMFVLTSFGFTAIGIKSIKLNSSKISLTVGQNFSLKVSYTPANTTQKILVYSTGNKNVATVDKAGLIKAVKPGSTVIAVTSSVNKSVVAKCNVTVKQVGTSQAATRKIKRLKITVDGNLSKFPSGMDENNNFIIKELEKRFGLDLIYQILPLNDSYQKLNILMSSGDAGDILSVMEMSLVGKYQQVGLITPIGDLIKDKKNIQKYCSDSKVSFTIDGKQYAFGPNNPRPAFSGTQIRKDWLLKAGFTKQPQTIDEFYNMLRTFKTKDFDGNGKDDTVPLALAALPDDLFAGVTWHLLRAMHNMPMNFLEKDGKIVYSLLEPQAKEFLKFANKLYIEGLIPKDFASLKAPDANELLLGNKAGVLTSTPWGLANNVKVVKEKYNGEIVYLDPPKSISGDKSYMPINRPIAQAVMVTKTCKDPKTAIDFMEMRFEEDLITLLNYGILNEHYTLINGKPIFTEKVVKGEIKTDWFVYFANPQPAELWHYNVSTNGSGFNETYSPQEKWIGKFFPADLYMPPQPKLKTIETELIAQVQKFYVDVITGNVKIDEFESARKKWLDAGGQDILEGYSKLYESLGKPKFSNVEIGKERDYKGIYMFDGKK